ncbi:halovibrin HvnC [Pseudomonas sp. B21-054]|uniref:halovibrin HvnC n=1 Tax=Pseudomonas sp. B21-054 TaxID=2895494 RepID=UPI00222FDF9E|nr:halovibrin HvnC [Pseudomonas sp. B21-054]UZE15327.1 halovibrin HvnC [Pseudomonas sp. B21-054]
MSHFLRQLIGLWSIALFVGCTQVAIVPPEVVNINGVQVLDGPGTATLLTTLYERRFPNCYSSDSQPSFLCSGVTLRVTVKDPAEQYKVWDPSPTSITSGGVSFSYLRADANFGRLAWGHGNGYILYPIFGAPVDKIDLDYLCSYPMDAWSWYRTPPCGASGEYPALSRPCHVAGVTTAQQWLGVWTMPGGNPYLRQCGFDVNDDRNQLAGPAFYQSLLSKGLVGARGFDEHNEIIIKTWTPGRPNTFPIMAFFFVAGGTNAGLADARYNQRDFYNSTNPKIVVPIIRLTPANSAAESATFSYVAADQAVTQ